jgi:hypothetical protein
MGSLCSIELLLLLVLIGGGLGETGRRIGKTLLYGPSSDE